MGCGGSKKPTVDQNRRRLSVGACDASAGNGAVTSGNGHEDRNMILELKKQDIMSMFDDTPKQAGGRRYSVGTKTDSALQSFHEKEKVTAGDIQTKTGIGYTCKKGLKPESPNQDSLFILNSAPDFALYGVFDGHGKAGHDASNFVKDNLPKLIVKDERFKNYFWPDADNGPVSTDQDLADVLVQAFEKVQSLIAAADQTKQLDAKLAGTTCTVCLRDYRQKKLTFAHVADSTGVVGNSSGIPKHITRDHKPDLPDEKSRIERAGGRVVFDGYANHRIYAKNARYPGLNMSRCLGDLMGHMDCGISAVPEVDTIQLDDTDNTLLLCSDGVWEFIKPSDALKEMAHYKNETEAAEKLAKKAWDAWIKEEGGAVVDDITVIYVNLGVDVESTA